MHIIAIGRLRAGPEMALFDRYNTRMRPRLTVVELPEARGIPAIAKRKEGTALCAALPTQAFVVALDPGGHALDSEALAKQIVDWTNLARPICFVIGGAEGLAHEVIAKANFVFSLGRLTWPHFLVRAMLAEQVYRAYTINQGHPYHRAGRPDV